MGGVEVSYGKGSGLCEGGPEVAGLVDASGREGFAVWSGEKTGLPERAHGKERSALVGEGNSAKETTLVGTSRM